MDFKNIPITDLSGHKIKPIITNDNKFYDNINLQTENNTDNCTSQLLLVDSSTMINKSEYIINLPTRLNYVTSIQLIDYNIPMSPYNITSSNNTLVVNNGYDGNDIYITLKSGIYDIESLLMSINKELKNNDCDSKFTYNSKTLIVSIKSNSSNVFYMSQSSLSSVLGFKSIDLKDNNEYNGNYPYNLNTDTFVSLFLTTGNGININHIEISHILNEKYM